MKIFQLSFFYHVFYRIAGKAIEKLVTSCSPHFVQTRHCVLKIAYRVAVLNTTLSVVTTALKSKYFIFSFPRLRIEPTTCRVHSRTLPLHHDLPLSAYIHPSKINSNSQLSRPVQTSYF